MTLLALLVGHATAGPADLLPRGSTTAYAGAGLSTFQYGSSGWIRDRVFVAREDLYVATAPRAGWEVFASVPGLQGWVREYEDRGPCPRETDYCDPIVTVGQLSLGLRRGFEAGPARLAVAARGHSGAWNRDTRDRFDAVDYAETGVELSVAAAWRLRAGPWRLDLDAAAGWDAVLKEDLGGLRGPLDTLRGTLGGELAHGRATLALGLVGIRKLGGLPYGTSWVEDWYPTEDRWIVLRYAAIQAAGKLSWNLTDHLGLHLAGTATLAAWSGPKDLVDVAVGVHRWFPPRGR